MAGKKEKRDYEDPKRFNGQKYALVLALTIIIFGAGMLLGNTIASNKFTSLENMGQDLRTDIIALELQQDLIAADPCGGASLMPLSEQLYTLGTRLDFMENRLGKNNAEVIRLKQYYSLLEIRHWLYLSRINEICNQSSVLILYFYSNLGDCPRCEEQGYVLSYLHDKYDSLMIYSLDLNMENVVLETIKKNYDIKTAPSLVINGDIHEGFNSRNQIEAVITNLSESSENS